MKTNLQSTAFIRLSVTIHGQSRRPLTEERMASRFRKINLRPTDKNGVTALLKSLSKLPFDRTATGGLNLTFSQDMSPDILKSLVISYFRLGGLHVGISVINSETLKDAMKNPDKYKSLTVRLYGFSEYFVSLPKWWQLAILNRTQN